MTQLDQAAGTAQLAARTIARDVLVPSLRVSPGAKECAFSGSVYPEAEKVKPFDEPARLAQKSRAVSRGLKPKQGKDTPLPCSAVGIFEGRETSDSSRWVQQPPADHLLGQPSFWWSKLSIMTRHLTRRLFHRATTIPGAASTSTSDTPVINTRRHGAAPHSPLHTRLR